MRAFYFDKPRDIKFIDRSKLLELLYKTDDFGKLYFLEQLDAIVNPVVVKIRNGRNSGITTREFEDYQNYLKRDIYGFDLEGLDDVMEACPTDYSILFLKENNEDAEYFFFINLKT